MASIKIKTPGMMGSEPSATPTTSSVTGGTKNYSTRTSSSTDGLPSTSKSGNWKYNKRWVDKDGYLVDNYGKRLPNQTKPFVPSSKNPFIKDKAPKTPKTPTQEERIKKGEADITEESQKRIDAYLKRLEAFDPNKFQQEYETQFTEGMQRSYDQIYGEFRRRNDETFARQQQDLNQSLVERGLDPNSPAYQALTKQLAQQQSDADLAAQNQAWQAAQGYQQQGYQQAVGTALLPGQMLEPAANIYQAGRAQQYDWQKVMESFRQQQELLRQQIAGDIQKLRTQKSLMGGGGGGGQPQENPYDVSRIENDIKNTPGK